MKRVPLWQARCLIRSPLRRVFASNGIYRPPPVEVQGAKLFHSSPKRNLVVPYMLADIGEGITECQIIEWFVEPGSRVEQFDRICEVQSDKASVEITSRFDGVVKALHYDLDDMAIVGKPLIDIDTETEVPVKASIDQEAEALLAQDIQRTTQPTDLQNFGNSASEPISSVSTALDARQAESKKGADIATPAVRHMLKQLELDIREISGTGKDGRVRKEDIDRYRSEEGTRAAELNPETALRAPPASQAAVQDCIVPLTHKENQMLKVMTQSLSIPHFLYTHPVELTLLNTLRTKSNLSKSLFTTPSSASVSNTKLTALPFIMKAISQALAEFPKVNAHLDVSTNPKKPQLILKASHSFGLAIDTPQGLVVPVVRNVQEHSITSLMTEINRIGALAHAGKLAPEDFKGATLSISNIGSIGGGIVSPVIVPPMVAIIGIGRTRTVPAFRTDLEGEEVLFKKEEVQLSWSADHRVLDGATVARCAERVGAILENIDLLGLALK